MATTGCIFPNGLCILSLSLLRGRVPLPQNDSSFLCHNLIKVLIYMFLLTHSFLTQWTPENKENP